MTVRDIGGGVSWLSYITYNYRKQQNNRLEIHEIRTSQFVLIMNVKAGDRM